MGRFETTLSTDGTHILTTHEGDVDIAQTLAAMAREAELLARHPEVRVVVFDYRSATMASHSSSDTQRAVDAAVRLLTKHPSVTFVGVAPEHIDFGIARMFEQRVDAAIGTKESPQRTRMVRSMDEALRLVSSLT